MRRPPGLGPTGRQPYRKISPDDEGELRLAVYVDDYGNVCLDFGVPVAWIGLPHDHAIALADAIMSAVEESRGKATQ